MTRQSKRTHVRDVLSEHAIWTLFVIGHNVLVTFAFQPDAETKLERIRACHVPVVIGSQTHFVLNGTQQTGLLFRGRTSGVENS